MPQPSSRIFDPKFDVDDYVHVNQGINEIYEEYGDVVSVDLMRKSLLTFGINNKVGTSRTTIMELPNDVLEETLLSNNGITHVVSSSTLDTQEITLLVGNTISGGDLIPYKKEGGITLTGTTPVPLPTALARCSLVRLETPATGTISVYEGGTVTAGVPDDASQVHLLISEEQTQSAKCQTSIGYQEYWMVTQFSGSLLKKSQSFIDFRLEMQNVNGLSFYPISQNLSVSDSPGTIILEYKPYVIVPKNSDVRITAVADVSNVQVSGGVSGFLARVVQ